jgi:hypothetical protein
VALDLRVDGRLVARCVANHTRPDLMKIGDGSGRHSFTIAWPTPLENTRHIITLSHQGSLLTGAHLILEPIPGFDSLKHALDHTEDWQVLLAAIETLLNGSDTERRTRAQRFAAAADLLAA